MTDVANDNAGPFSIGQNMWPGIAKLAEECGELVQIIGKLIATGGRTDHWSGLDLRKELEDEMADVRAALAFVWEHNDLDVTHMAERMRSKIDLFEDWHGRALSPHPDAPDYIITISSGMQPTDEQWPGVDTSKPDDHGIVRRLP